MRLEANHVSFRYSGKSPWILEDLSLGWTVESALGLFAPSGYGKSTLARLLAGYLTPQAGQILLDGKPLPQRGICPVQLILPASGEGHQSPVAAEAGPGGERDAPAGRPGLFWHRTRLAGPVPRELSGGELQRFCVARALMSGGRIF